MRHLFPVDQPNRADVLKLRARYQFVTCAAVTNSPYRIVLLTNITVALRLRVGYSPTVIPLNNKKVKISRLQAKKAHGWMWMSSSSVFCPRAGPPLQTQAPRLEFCPKAGLPLQTQEPRLQFY